MISGCFAENELQQTMDEAGNAEIKSGEKAKPLPLLSSGIRQTQVQISAAPLSI